MSVPGGSERALPAATGAEHGRAAALAFMRRGVEMTAERMLPVDCGWVVRHTGFPHVWDLNRLSVVRPASTSAALDLVDAHLHDLPFRHIEVEDQPTGDRLEADLTGAGWRVQALLVMILTAEPPPASRGGPVIAAEEDETVGLMRRWHQEDFPQMPSSVLDELGEHRRRLGAAWAERRFGARDAAGNLAAVAKLRSDGSTAQVEDVYTVPEWRRHGCARTLVTHAVRLALDEGHRVVFIVADQNDWPQHLYAEVGFRPVALVRTLHRDGR